jgi:hypothetical protein
VLVAIIAPERWLAAACDTYSIAHTSTLIVGGLGLVTLALSTPFLRAPAGRLAAGVAAGALAAAWLAWFAPACLGEPFGAIDPLLKSKWLAYVSEAMPLIAALRMHPDTTIPMVAPILFGLCGLVIAAWRGTGPARASYLVILAVAAGGVAGMFWDIRVATTLAPVALLAGARARAVGLPAIAGAALTIAAAVPSSGIVWSFVPLPGARAASSTGDKASESCHAPAAFDALASLPAGIVLATIDSGAFILAHTAHSVVAAPFHRDNAGNLLALRAFSGTPAQARDLARTSGAAYLAFCADDFESQNYAIDPLSLAATLVAGDPPDWLAPLPSGAGPLRLFAIRETDVAKELRKGD